MTEPEMLDQLAKWSSEINRLLQEMKQDQIEIDRLNEGTRARLANIEKVIARIASNNAQNDPRLRPESLRPGLSVL